MILLYRPQNTNRSHGYDLAKPTREMQHTRLGLSFVEIYHVYLPGANQNLVSKRSEIIILPPTDLDQKKYWPVWCFLYWHCFLLYVNIQPYWTMFNDSFAEPQVKLRHEWEITRPFCMGVSVSKRNPCVVCYHTSNGSWCMGINGEMSGTVCVTFTWYMYIYELFIAFVCFVVCSLL